MKGAEEVVKSTENKSKSDEKSPDNKDNKRCDSVTGSNLDSSSSSNSSIDSDDLEQMVDNYAKTKVTMTASGTTPSAIDTNNKQTNHKSDKRINGYGEEAQLKSHTENAKPVNGTVMVNDSTDHHALNGKAQRSATKKQARRERRQKEKEKRNGENQYQQAQEKASRHRMEQASMVQNLLSLRIADNQTIVQKRAQQTVPVSFGDFPEQNRTLGQSQQSAFALQDPNNDKELVQVYTAGHNLQGLFRRDEPQAVSKVDKNSNYNGRGSASQDGMEMDNVLKMVHDSNKLAQKYSPWMRSFHNSLVDGDPVVFQNKFTCILRILKKSAGRVRYDRMTERQFTQHVMIGVIRQFYNEKQHTTVLHQLAATRNVGTPCSVRGHGSCKMIRTVLGMLSWEDMRSTMRVRTARTGKTAMHLAAATGQWCQLDALMSYDMCPNALDRSGRAPIHYAVTNNDLTLVKMLLWYGADLSLMERQCTPLQLASLNPCTLEVANYLDIRRDALESVFMRWVESFVRGVWTPTRAISDLHFMRLSKEGDSRYDAVRNIETHARSTTLNITVNVSHKADLKKSPLSLLFIIPTFYKNEDRFYDASDPQIFRASMTSDRTGDICKLMQSRPLLKGKKFEAKALEPAFTNPHNGHFYVFELPRSLPQGVYTLNFSVNTEPLKEKALHINLAIQAFACGAPELRQWEAMRLRLDKSKIE